MKAWEIVGCTHDGECVCPSCYTRHEALCMADIEDDGDVSPMFAGDMEQDEVCGRCGCTIES